MYDKEGAVVPTVQRGNPFRGCNELRLKSGETASFYLIFTTPKEIANFEIYVSYLPAVQT